MPKVECTLTTCIHNVEKDCKNDTVYLKWRFAADMGKGNIVCVECLNFELPKGEG